MRARLSPGASTRASRSDTVGLPGPRIGLDFGGVIVGTLIRERAAPATAAGHDGEVAARPGVFEAVRHLIQAARGNVWIVSKAGPRMQALTADWLRDVDFYGRTGFTPEHLVFCLERDEKKPICEGLGITHFVDDRIHIMQILRHAVPNLFLFMDKPTQCPPWAVPVTSWPETKGAIERSLSRNGPP